MSDMIIPEPVQDGLRKLFELPRESAEQLLKALQNERPSSNAQFVSQRIASASPLDRATVDSILVAIFSLYSFKDAFEFSPEDAVNEILTSPTLKLGEEEQERYHPLLFSFLNNIGAVSLTSKATDLLFARDCIYRSARLVTDARPIFNEDATEEPAFVIIHTLKINYTEGAQGGPRKSISLALDADDIEELEEILERARTKDDSLRTLFNEKKVLVLEDEEE